MIVYPSERKNVLNCEDTVKNNFRELGTNKFSLNGQNITATMVSELQIDRSCCRLSSATAGHILSIHRISKHDRLLDARVYNTPTTNLSA